MNTSPEDVDKHIQSAGLLLLSLNACTPGNGPQPYPAGLSDGMMLNIAYGEELGLAHEYYEYKGESHGLHDACRKDCTEKTINL